MPKPKPKPASVTLTPMDPKWLAPGTVLTTPGKPPMRIVTSVKAPKRLGRPSKPTTMHHTINPPVPPPPKPTTPTPAQALLVFAEAAPTIEALIVALDKLTMEMRYIAIYLTNPELPK